MDKTSFGIRPASTSISITLIPGTDSLILTHSVTRTAVEIPLREVQDVIAALGKAAADLAREIARDDDDQRPDD